MDPESLQGWLLKLGEYRKRLRAIVETFVNWLSNKDPPLAAYHEFMSGRLIALDKQHVFFPAGVRENWRRLFAKCVLRVTGPEATSASQDDQLCSGLKLEIGDAVHGIQAIWDTKLTT